MLAQDQFVKIELAQRPSNKSNYEVTSLTDQKKPNTLIHQAAVNPFGKMSNPNLGIIQIGNQANFKYSNTEQKPQVQTKFVQSFQMPTVNNTLIIKQPSQIGAALTSNGFNSGQQVHTFEKDSFPKRNITQKLRNA